MSLLCIPGDAAVLYRRAKEFCISLACNKELEDLVFTFDVG